MEAFINEGRSTKSIRMAMAIGHDADEGVLKRFLVNSGKQLFYAHKARDIREFFDLVAMSVTVRTRSDDPDDVPEAEPLDRENSSNDSPDDFG